MPLIARKDGSGDVVNTIHVSCIVPVDISTLSGSSDVFIVGHGCHREDDTNEPHDHCPPVSSTTVNSFSPDVYVNGKKVARLNDTYTCTAKIVTVQQTTVYANGD
tara:strand:- start:201 stop:515 length:315 start_codon:yes stop_codon:yes gene_type:complete